jgi:hypothetical protein
MSERTTKQKRPPLPSDVWQHPENGQRWHQQNVCVTCGGHKDDTSAHHCEQCYEIIFPSIFDYDDD